MIYWYAFIFGDLVPKTWGFHIPPNGVLYAFALIIVITVSSPTWPYFWLIKIFKKGVTLFYYEFTPLVPPLNQDRLVGCEKVPLLVKGNWMIKTLILVSNICLKVFGMVNEYEFPIYQSKKKLNTKIKQICHKIKCRIYGLQCLIKPMILAYPYLYLIK